MTHLICPRCGASLIGVEQCRDYFDYCLEKEFVDPGYGAVHHLTVAAYMLQHPNNLSERGWREMRTVLAAFLIEGKTPAQMRVENRDRMENSKRDWHITNGLKVTLTPHIRWTRTIADVNLSDAATYCCDVETWAKSVLTDLEREQL